MITVIKHGKETFTVTCPVCGCIFTYHAEDLETDMFGNHHVKCPDCHQPVSHDEPKKKGIRDGNDSITWDKSLEDYMKLPPDTPIPDVKLYGDYSCDGCLYYEQQKRNPEMVPVVGDTPCTWCKKRMPYCTVNATGTTPRCLTSPEDIDLPQ